MIWSSLRYFCPPCFTMTHERPLVVVWVSSAIHNALGKRFHSLPMSQSPPSGPGYRFGSAFHLYSAEKKRGDSSVISVTEVFFDRLFCSSYSGLVVRGME